MQFRGVLALTLGLFAFIANAAINQTLSDLPACGLSCIFEALSNVGCALNNSTCTCSEEFAAAVNLCAEKNCSIIEGFQVRNISDRACGIPVRSQAPSLIGTVVLGTVAAVILNIRLASRWKLDGEFRSDDWVMVVVNLTLIPFGVVGTMTALKGFGHDMWNIVPNDITSAFEYFYWGSLLYVTVISLCKISVLIFYLRIFPYANFRIACYVLLGWVAITMVMFQLLSLLQCLPISYNWEGWKDGHESTKCLDLTALTYASAVINIAQDIVILILPVPWLLKLHTTKKKKINILAMFNIGILLCMCSIIRLTKIVALKDSKNKTWDYASTIFWTAIEVYLAIIIPCLPATRRLILFRFPHIFKPDDNSRFAYERTDARSSKKKVSRGTITRIIEEDERDVENGETSRNRVMAVPQDDRIPIVSDAG